MIVTRNYAQANQLVDILREKSCRLVVAESCTGGLLGGALTAIPGSSEVFMGGVIAYANTAKIALLGVEENLLARYGAVSEEVALAMAEGVLNSFAGATQAELSISITGIAGPGGATKSKPVGLVYLAGICTRDKPRRLVVREVFSGDRAAVREQAVARALKLALEIITGGKE